MSSVVVEVVCRNFILRVINQVDTFQQVLLYQVVSLFYAMTEFAVAIINVDSNLRICNVGDTSILTALGVIFVCLRENVDQYKVQVST